MTTLNPPQAHVFTSPGGPGPPPGVVPGCSIPGLGAAGGCAPMQARRSAAGIGRTKNAETFNEGAIRGHKEFALTSSKVEWS